VPQAMEELLRIPGIGRKTANLIRGDVFGLPAIVADTHCIRLSGRLGLTDKKDPAGVEKDLVAIIDPEKQNDLCHRFVMHGRAVCTARAPACGRCPLAEFCPAAK
ncbi:MAG: endonuclease III, partial [Clostridia bacterium]|nr:endonuclease III [Clostridia bacterium]